MMDAFARDISYARISLTDACNLRCSYCMPPCAAPSRRQPLDDDEVIRLVEGLAAAGIRKIRFTGGEPSVRPGFLHLLRRACAVPSVDTWAVTTNALTLARDAKALREAGIDLINISLDTMDPAAYHTLTGGSLQAALDGLQAALEAGFRRVKLNAVLIRGISEREIPRLAAWAHEKPIDVRFIELMPMGPCQAWAKEHFLPAAAVLAALPGLQPDAPEPHAPAVYYRLAGYQGRIGLITPMSCDFCGDCNRIRITADGKLCPCLHADTEIDLRDVLHDPAALAARLTGAVQAKPARHQLSEGRFITRGMSQVGG